MPHRVEGSANDVERIDGLSESSIVQSFELPLRIGPVQLYALKLNLPLVELDDYLFAGAWDVRDVDMPSFSAAVTAVPDQGLTRPTVSMRHGHIDYVHHRCVRCWVDMRGTFEAYQSRCLSAKLRSDIRRQNKRFLQHAGEDALDVRYYRTPAEISEFSALAEQVSATTFQERKAGCGWPRNEGFEQRLIQLAEHDGCCGTIMFAKEKPVSYQYMVKRGKRFIGQYMGFDPEYQKFSPGKIHMLACIMYLFDDPTCDIYDFAGGNFRNLIEFSSDRASCADMLRLSFCPRHLMLIGTHLMLASITNASTILFDVLGLKERLRKMLRGR
jgi:hypothetical protein